MKKKIHDQDMQFTLSYELLCLLEWLMQHEGEKLRKIVHKAVQTHSFHEKIQALDQQKSADELGLMHISILDFFNLLESFLQKSLHDRVTSKARSQNLLSSLDQFDATVCDQQTMHSCLEKTTTAIDSNPSLNAKEQLFKEILKQWKPDKKMAHN